MRVGQLSGAGPPLNFAISTRCGDGARARCGLRLARHAKAVSPKHAMTSMVAIHERDSEISTALI